MTVFITLYVLSMHFNSEKMMWIIWDVQCQGWFPFEISFHLRPGFGFCLNEFKLAIKHGSLPGSAFALEGEGVCQIVLFGLQSHELNSSKFTIIIAITAVGMHSNCKCKWSTYVIYACLKSHMKLGCGDGNIIPHNAGEEGLPLVTAIHDHVNAEADLKVKWD